MTIWELDFYRSAAPSEAGDPAWELRLCERNGDFRYCTTCLQSAASSAWLLAQLRQVMVTHSMPTEIRVFRPQTLNLLEPIAAQLEVPVVPTRRTPKLKQWLLERSTPTADTAAVALLELDRPPPLPLPEALMGDRWRFAALPAADLFDAFRERMIPIVDLPAEWQPLKLGLAYNQAIPGVVIDGGRQSLRLAQWLQQVQPVGLNFVMGAPDGLVLEAGLVDRYILATFEDAEVRSAAQTYAQRQQQSQGLHFLLVQPDDSGMTYSGVWLLKTEA
jgi:hypothetical protein